MRGVLSFTNILLGNQKEIGIKVSADSCGQRLGIIARNSLPISILHGLGLFLISILYGLGSQYNSTQVPHTQVLTLRKILLTNRGWMRHYQAIKRHARYEWKPDVAGAAAQ
jgi:hypothetical protein